MKKENFTLLIIDDDQKIIELITTFLKIRFPKIIVVSSNDVREGQFKLENQDFDLVLIDQFINGKTGLDFISQMRRTLKHSNKKFVLMSGALGTQEVAQAINLGITDILVKPFPLKHLQEKILKYQS